MTLELVKFGEMLVSRPSGREAYLSAKAYLFKDQPPEIIINFAGVKVLTPSWLDEFLTLLKKNYPATKISFLKSSNPSVTASLKILSKI